MSGANTKRNSNGTGGKIFFFIVGMIVGSSFETLVSFKSQAGLASIQEKITELQEVVEKAPPEPVAMAVTRREEVTNLQCDEFNVPNFVDLGKKKGTDKVQAFLQIDGCLKDESKCFFPKMERETCRPWGHFYNTMYQQKLPRFSNPNEKFQFLEIGYYNGKGYDTYDAFYEGVPGAELHSMEISCIEEGPRSEGKWPWGNFAEKNKRYKTLLKKKLLHCGDASNVKWLHETWNTHMHREDAPPLKVVIDDASHIAQHMATSVFFWLPRIEPGGFMIVEDIQPINDANRFRTDFMPQLMSDLHFCGDPKHSKDEACFPQLYPYIQSIHCEMHICVIERNDKPAQPKLSVEESKLPPNALDLNQCYSFAHKFGRLDKGR